ncbi:MAG: zf-HC2 domain-containing protein [Anaerolineae bacterium]
MEHLSDETLAAAVEGRLTPKERRRVLRHLAACPRCAEAWAALHALAQHAGTLPPAPLEHPLEQALGWLRAIAPFPAWAWHLLLFGLVPLAWLAAVDAEALPKLGVFRYTLQAWPAAWLMTTHFLWLQSRLRELMEGLWAAGLPAEQVEAFQRRYLAILQGQGVGGIWLFLGLALVASLGNWWLAPPAQVGEGLKAYGIGFYALWATAAMYWGWVWGGRLWWGLGRLVQAHPRLRDHPVLARGRRLAAGWVVVAGVSMLWHLLLSMAAPEIHGAARAWGALISLVLLSLWGGYAALEWQLAPRPLLQRGNGWLVARLALTLALVAMTLPALR